MQESLGGIRPWYNSILDQSGDSLIFGHGGVTERLFNGSYNNNQWMTQMVEIRFEILF